MNAKTVSDSITPTIEELVASTTKMKAGKIKLLDHLGKIESFDEDEPNMDRKEFTRLINDLDGAVTKYYDYRNRDVERDYSNDLEKIAKKMGYDSVYEATDKNHADPFLRAVHFFHVYGLYEVKRKVEEIEKSSPKKFQQAFVDKYYPNIMTWYELACKTAEIKEILNPTKEQKQARELLKIKGAVNPEIKKSIDEIAENFRKFIEEKEYNWMIRLCDRFKELFPDGTNDKDQFERKNRQFFASLSGFVKQQMSTNYVIKYVLIPDYDTKAKIRAKRVSEETIKSWQMKMYNKLGGFITELGKKFTTSVEGGSIGYNRIRFKFDDGSQFELQNQIVDKTSNLGTYFYTYPTTFHNAFLPDGSKIANPNEYTVKKAFNDF